MSLFRVKKNFGDVFLYCKKTLKVFPKMFLGMYSGVSRLGRGGCGKCSALPRRSNGRDRPDGSRH